MEHLLHLSPSDLVCKLSGLLASFVSKDFKYAVSRLKYEPFGSDFEVDMTNHSLDIDQVSF